MVIQHNLASMFASREFHTVTESQSKHMEKLSSGYRINRAGDDAAGLSISEKMRSQIRGLRRAADNIQDGISFLQSGEGALNEVHSMLHRIRELAVQASNDTNNVEDRQYIDKEVQQLKSEMNRIFKTTEYNKINIFATSEDFEPDIYGSAADYELYNRFDGTSAGGVMINNKRYSWAELGAPVESRATDWVKEITDPDNPDELIRLKVLAGEDCQQMRRVYVMKGDSDGIKINNLLAVKWEDIGRGPDNQYTFSYRGMDILFEAEDYMVEELKSKGRIMCSWDALPAYGASGNAAISHADLMTFNVTNGNKNDIEQWEYRICADDDGVFLKQEVGNDGLNHSKTLWKNFTNTNGTDPFPISDWGVDANGNDPVTLDSSAEYRYTDGATAGCYTNQMSFTFEFTENEISRYQITHALTQDISGRAVSAPIASVTGDSGVSVTSYSNFDFHYQRDVLLRDFGTNGSSAPITVNVERTSVKEGTVDDHEYRLKLSAAYAKKINDYTDKRVTTYTGVNSVSFVDLNGDELIAPQGSQYNSSYPHSITENNINSGSESEYVANTGLNANYSETTGRTLSSTVSSEIVRRNVYNENGTHIGYADINFATKIEEIRDTASRYEKQGGSIKNYVKTGADSYSAASYNTLYVKDNNSTTLDYDNDEGYRMAASADTGAQRYLRVGDGWKKIATYDLVHYTYSGKNTAGTEVMSKKTGTPSFLNTGSDNTSIVIHDSAGRTTTYKTENTSDVLKTTITDTANGKSIGLNYKKGYGDRSSTVTITPNGVATRSFYKSEKTGGSTRNTINGSEINRTMLPDKLLHIQAGPNPWQSIDLEYPCLTNTIIGIAGARTKTFEDSQNTIEMADNAIEYISDVRSKFGAMQNRLEHAFNIAQNLEENTQAAESKIRDADMAKEMVALAMKNILSQAGLSMLSGANRSFEGVLALLS